MVHGLHGDRASALLRITALRKSVVAVRSNTTGQHARSPSGRATQHSEMTRRAEQQRKDDLNAMQPGVPNKRA